MRLLDRRETIVGLENQLCLARTKLEQEEDASAESWRRVKDKSEQLSNDQFEYIHLYKVPYRIIVALAWNEDTVNLWHKRLKFACSRKLKKSEKTH